MPAVGFPPGTPFTLQVRAVFDVPVTVAVSCCGLPSNTLELGVETVTVMGPVAEADELFPPQSSKSTREAAERSAMTAVACAEKEERAGKDARSAYLALASVMVSSVP